MQLSPQGPSQRHAFFRFFVDLQSLLDVHSFLHRPSKSVLLGQEFGVRILETWKRIISTNEKVWKLEICYITGHPLNLPFNSFYSLSRQKEVTKYV